MQSASQIRSQEDLFHGRDDIFHQRDEASLAIEQHDFVWSRTSLDRAFTQSEFVSF